MGPDLEQLEKLALEAAHAAGALLLEGRDRARTDVATKTSLTDMVSEMDRAAETLVAEIIRGARPDDGFLAEEGMADAGVEHAAVRWVVDPLDGTTNYLYGIPSWSVSIAAEVGGRPAVGVVFDPSQDETYAAVRGRGATCNGRGLEVTGAADLATSLVATGFSYDAARRGEQGATVARLLPFVRDVRRAGAASIDLCWVAKGRVDAYYERGLQPWDWAAGTLVAEEAGAVVSSMADGTLVAAAAHLHGPLLKMLERFGAG